MYVAIHLRQAKAILGILGIYATALELFWPFATPTIRTRLLVLLGEFTSKNQYLRAGEKLLPDKIDANCKPSIYKSKYQC